jgi:hypothetical protein
LTILCICLLLTVAEIVLLARHKLKPLTFLITNVIKSTIWVVLFILEIVSLTTSRNSHTASALAIIIEGALLCVLLANIKLENANLGCRLCFWIPLVYGGIIYHRFRKNAKSYKPVDHPESNIPDPYPVQHTEYPFPTQYQSYAKPVAGEETNAIPGRPLSYHQGQEGFEPYREHRRSVSDSGNRPMGVPNIHVPEHGQSFEMEARGRSPR